MKNFSYSLLLSLLAIAIPLTAKAASEDFCDKFPLNSRCRQEPTQNQRNSSQNNSDAGDSKIVDTLTIDEVENYLKELGYIDVTRNEDNYLSLFIQGRLCSIFIAENGKGMSLFSYYPKDEKITLEVLNDWNKSLRYSFAYLYTTKKNNEVVILETNLTVTGGVSEKRIKSFFVLHADYQSYFTRYLSEL